jgi:hypothetical protein
MSTTHSRKERWFPYSDKSEPVMNDNRLKFKFDRGLFGNFLQLMLGHCLVRLVIDSLDPAPILGAADDPLKINSRARSGIHSVLWRIELRFCHQNFANRICHKVQVLATVSRPCFKLLGKKISK